MGLFKGSARGLGEMTSRAWIFQILSTAQAQTHGLRVGLVPHAGLARVLCSFLDFLQFRLKTKEMGVWPTGHLGGLVPVRVWNKISW